MAIPLQNDYLDFNVNTSILKTPSLDTSSAVPLFNSDTHLSTISDINNTSILENNDNEIHIHGRRIVNISHLINEIKNIENHEPFDCGFKNMHLIGERIDLVLNQFSTLHVPCAISQKVCQQRMNSSWP